jgi:hypothetical protein
MVNVNKVLIVAVVALASALVFVLLYHSGPASSNGSSSGTNLKSLVFQRGVESWLVLRCIYNTYGPNAALDALNRMYLVAYNQLNNGTYPISQYDALTRVYPGCRVNASLNDIYALVQSSSQRIVSFATYLGLSTNQLGTPMFVVFNRQNNATYVVLGATLNLYDVMNYTERGIYNATVRYAVGFRASPTQARAILDLTRDALVFGNSNSSIIVMELLDPTCPFCAVFQVQMANQLDSMVRSGTVEYVVVYFPTHVLSYLSP